MSQDESAAQQQDPEICPIAAIRIAANQTPNRRNTKLDYHHHGSLNFEEGTVKCLSHKGSGSLLFVMPDGSGYTIDTAIAGNQVYKYWKKTSLEGGVPTPIDPGLQDPIPELS